MDVFQGQDSSVAIVTSYGLDDPRIEWKWGQDFSGPSSLAPKPTQPPLQWVQVLSGG